MAATEISPAACADTSRLLKKLRPHAVIDWIEIEITCARSSNFSTVQRALQTALRGDRKSYVTSINEGPGGAAKRFLVKIQDPPPLIKLKGAFEELRTVFGFEEIPKLNAIEASMDFYGRTSDSGPIWEMVRLLMLGIWADGTDRRLARRRNETVILRYAERLDLNKTLYIGNKWDPVAWHVDLKETDNNGKPLDPA